MRIGVFSPQLFGSVKYYAALARLDKAIIDTGLRYNKRFKSAHRYTIADTRGKLTLTVPVTHPTGEIIDTWHKVKVSSHGQWWSDHMVSLESAYGRTPFFEFYIERFKPWIRDIDCSVIKLDTETDRIIRNTLGLKTDVKATPFNSIPTDQEGMEIKDYRDNLFEDIKDIEYYQVRADRLGFIKDLSILDLLFNMGTEAPLVLRDMAK